MITEIETIGADKVRNVLSDEVVELSSFWQDNDVVIIFLRRWGCMMSKLWSKEVSEIAPTLKFHHVKLIGIGLDATGAKEFQSGNYFNGDLYYVDNIVTYHALGFKKLNIITVLISLVWGHARNTIFKAREMGIESDFVGDGLQNGGALLLKKGGKVVRHFVQINPTNRLSNDDILECFNLEEIKFISNAQCKVKSRSTITPIWKKIIQQQTMAPIHTIWTNRSCKCAVNSTKL